mgnify:CR=1 FL=1|tara:strand:+ start:110 stop:769 length:660 start_codon:yes stop_codon:yes gene_type:complete
MKYSLFFYLLFVVFLKIGFSSYVVAQSEIAPIIFSTEKEKNNLLISPKNPSLFGGDFLKPKPLEIKDPTLNFNAPKARMDLNEAFINPGDYYLSRLKNPENKKNPKNFKTNQYLGDFKSNGEFVEIIFRDHEYPDGDRVQILVNDIIVVSNVLLEESFKGINFKLGSGFNKIDFVALNQGETGPNTAEVRVFDDQGKLITSNQWNLATGVRATLIVVKN